jgi:tetratricopeptide (TPR) repeat protein
MKNIITKKNINLIILFLVLIILVYVVFSITGLNKELLSGIALTFISGFLGVFLSLLIIRYFFKDKKIYKEELKLYNSIALMRLKYYNPLLKEFQIKNSDDFYLQGYEFLDRKKYTTAAFFFRKEIMKSPFETNAWVYLCKTNRILKNYNEALKNITIAIELNGYNPVYLDQQLNRTKADILKEIKKYQKAIEILQEAKINLQKKGESYTFAINEEIESITSLMRK